MKKIFLLIIFFLSLIKIQSQSYLITFAGSGASNNVDSVKIENLSKCISLTIGGKDTLKLTPYPSVNIPYYADLNLIHVYPNPSNGCFTIEISSAIETNANILLYDITGKAILKQSKLLKKGNQKFNIEGISKGIYFLKAESDSYMFSSKLISYGGSVLSPELTTSESAEYLNSKNIQGNHVIPSDPTNTKSIISMLYSMGDTLKLTGKSGNYRTIKMLFPTGNQTVTFNFVDCTDAIGNHYAVVQIGSQIWMAENLKTTKYRNGTSIPNVQDSATWGSITYGAYCNYHNDTAEGNYYGRLYNFYAVSDVRNIAPVGWHVASNYEWNIMEKYLDPTVDTSATAWMGRGRFIGRILKEGCNTRWQYMDTTYGWNSAGFTALCSNFRTSSGSWAMAPNNNHDNAFWSSTPYLTNTAWGLSLRWCFGDIYVMPLINKRAGQSVRCIKD